MPEVQRDNGRMMLQAVTVFGRDRPGIVAQATAALAELGGNLEDSTMTLLRGRFAMLLLVRTAAGPEQVRAALSPLSADGTLQVDVRPVAEDPAPTSAEFGVGYLLSVHGADRPGIVSALTSVVAQSEGSVTDLSTRLTGELYLLLAEISLPPAVDPQALTAQLKSTANHLGVDVTFTKLDPDEL